MQILPDLMNCSYNWLERCTVRVDNNNENNEMLLKKELQVLHYVPNMQNLTRDLDRMTVRRTDGTIELGINMTYTGAMVAHVIYCLSLLLRASEKKKTVENVQIATS